MLHKEEKQQYQPLRLGVLNENRGRGLYLGSEKREAWFVNSISCLLWIGEGGGERIYACHAAIITGNHS
jgi:hypothetical protein